MNTQTNLSPAALHQLQQDYFFSNRTKDVDFRITQLKKLRQLLKDNEKELFSAIYDDFGKSEYETYLTELALLYHEIDSFIREIPRWSKRIRVRTGLANFGSRSYIIPEPLGVTLVIGAWNYPYQLSLVPAVCALAAGNTVVLKPSELPSATSALMARLINEHFPAECFHVVEGGVATTTALLDLAFDKIFFTGSIPVGRVVYQAAARHLTPVTLELGGKSPTFVFAGCDLQRTAQRIVWAKFLNAGQTCVAPDYVLVEKVIEEDFLAALKIEIDKQHTHGNELKENYVSIINDRNFERVLALIDDEKLYCGGMADRESRYISPTVLHRVSFQDVVMQDEIFGPVLPVLSFTDVDEVIREVKCRTKPLSCYVYAKDRKMIERILTELSFGGGAVNDSIMHLSNPNLPFGGVGHSGMGSYHGKAGFDTFTHYKSILDSGLRFEAPMKYLPYRAWKMKVLRWIFE